MGDIYPLHKGAARMSFSYAYARANVTNKEEYYQRREMRLKQKKSCLLNNLLALCAEILLLRQLKQLAGQSTSCPALENNTTQ